ncbi:MAG: hypothetical protein SNJ77_03650, partial [Cytophagales bacterium]
LLMVSNIRFVSLKKSRMRISNQFKFILLICSISLFMLMKAFSGIAIMLVYIALSLLHEKKTGTVGG